MGNSPTVSVYLAQRGRDFRVLPDHTPLVLGYGSKEEATIPLPSNLRVYRVKAEDASTVDTIMKTTRRREKVKKVTRRDVEIIEYLFAGEIDLDSEEEESLSSLHSAQMK